MNIKAKAWAEDYFQRFDAMVKSLQEHPLINKVVYLQFQGLTDAEIELVEQKITLELNEQAEDWEKKDYPYQEAFSFDDYMKEFYKISNGLHLDWNSHLFPTNIEKSVLLKNQPINAMCFPRTDGSEIPEGKICLFALDRILNHGDYGYIYGDPQDSSYGEDLAEEGGLLRYLDYFNDYHDAAIALEKGADLHIVLGEDHSASYDGHLNYSLDFVMYMEFVLATYASTIVRGRGLSFQAKRSFDVDKKFQTIFDTKKYKDLVSLMKRNRYNDLEHLLKTHFEENGYQYGTLDNFKSKPLDLYHQIEAILKITIEDEFE